MAVYLSKMAATIVGPWPTGTWSMVAFYYGKGNEIGEALIVANIPD